MVKDYKRWHDRLSAGFAPYEKAINFLNRILTYGTYAAYPLALILYWFMEKPRGNTMLKLIFIPAVSFVMLTYIRDRIDRPRPYEQYDIRQLIKKNTRGHSFPSRHVFSMACISMVFMYMYVPLGILFAVFTVILAALRVIGGVHYPEDVLRGAAIGFVSGALVFIL